MFNSIFDNKTRNILKNVAKIKGFQVCITSNNKHKEVKERPFLIFSPDGKAVYIFNDITTNYQSRKSLYLNQNKPQALNSIIKIEPSDINNILKESSCIDCNSNELKTLNEISDMLASDTFFVIEQEIPEELKQKIIVAIINSPNTSPRIKALMAKMMQIE
jgi:hypothetical protein